MSSELSRKPLYEVGRLHYGRLLLGYLFSTQ